MKMPLRLCMPPVLLALAAACADTVGPAPGGVGEGGGAAAASAHRSASASAPPRSREGALYVVRRGPGGSRTFRVRIDETRREIHLEPDAGAQVRPRSLAEAGSCSAFSLTCEGTASEAFEGSLEVTGEDRGYVETGLPADPSLPVYDPERGIGDYTSEDVAAFYCPSVWEHARFTWQGHTFSTRGYATLLQRLPSSAAIPHGRYRLPSGTWHSDDGKARIRSGTLDGMCFIRDYYWLGFLIRGGTMGWYRFTGIFEVPGEGESFAFASVGGGGGGGRADDALEAYVTEGRCTPGWVIIVDGARVC